MSQHQIVTPGPAYPWTAAVEEVRFDGATYRLPFQDHPLLPPHKPDERALLKETILAIVVTNSLTGSAKVWDVIDGTTRLEICLELGLPPTRVPFHSKAVADLDGMTYWAVVLNAARRQIGQPDPVRLAAQARASRVHRSPRPGGSGCPPTRSPRKKGSVTPRSETT